MPHDKGRITEEPCAMKVASTVRRGANGNPLGTRGLPTMKESLTGRVDRLGEELQLLFNEWNVEQVSIG